MVSNGSDFPNCEVGWLCAEMMLLLQVFKAGLWYEAARAIPPVPACLLSMLELKQLSFLVMNLAP